MLLFFFKLLCVVVVIKCCFAALKFARKFALLCFLIINSDLFEDVPLVEFMYLIFTRMPGESYRRRLRSLLCLCDDSRVLINSLVC